MHDLEQRGFRMCRRVVSRSAAYDLAQAIAQASPAEGALARRGSVFGMRNLFSAVPAVRRLAASRAVRDLVEPVLGPGAVAVRGIFFDKTAEANWHLRWHQDVAIPVKERHDVPGFGPWSVKAGVTHAYPPVEVLEGMLTVRLHLDPCDATQGALQVLPGSHNMGLLSRETLARLVSKGEPVVCAAEPGDALLMRPLIAHASGECERPVHRRIVHIEFAGKPLPAPLEWHENVGPTGPGQDPGRA